MRVSFNHQYDTFVRDLGRAESNWFEAQQRVTTGKRINAMSDDPVGAGKVIGMRTLRAALDQHSQNLGTAKTGLSFAENSLDEVQKLLRRANQIALEGANSSTSQEGRLALADEISSIQKRLVDIGNTQGASGQYIFAGQKTDTKPFSATGDVLTYSGDTQEIMAEVSPTDTMATNIIADRLFGDAYSALATLKKDLTGGDIASLSGVDIPAIQNSEKAIGLGIGQIGVRLSSLEGLKSQHTRRMDELTANISEVEDVDMSQAIVSFKQAETAYQAALQSVSLGSRLSLMNYM